MKILWLFRTEHPLMQTDLFRYKHASYYVRMKPGSVKLANVHFIVLADRFLSWSKNIEIWPVWLIIQFIYLNDCPAQWPPYSKLKLNNFLGAHPYSYCSLNSWWLGDLNQRPTKLSINNKYCMRFDFWVMSALMLHWYLLTLFQLHRSYKLGR
jgi:hypothetical protein